MWLDVEMEIDIEGDSRQEGIYFRKLIGDTQNVIVRSYVSSVHLFSLSNESERKKIQLYSTKL